MFFSGSLQEGITLALQQQKAVVCFVRDDGPTSSLWEEEYFADDELSRVLDERSVLLRFAKDAPDTGFLTSFCPIQKYPTVVVILNGMLREYVMSDVSKEDFMRRIRVAVGDPQPPPVTESSTAASNDTQAETPSTAAPVAPAPASVPESESATAAAPSTSSDGGSGRSEAPKKPETEQETNKRVNTPTEDAPSTSPAKAQKKPVQKAKSKDTEAKPAKKNDQTTGTADTSEEKAGPPAPTPPKQYRLQVRLFDGRSVRSSFEPSHTIGGNVRAWLDGQLEENTPYNLKHILTPLPNRTLSITDEEQTLEELGLGSSANLVMVPIQSYTEAYSAGWGLPGRPLSSAYELVSSAVGAATGMVGSLLGYSQPSSQTNAPANTPPPAPAANRPRPPTSGGMNIRTLRDQRAEQGDNEFYNGNQLNFQPREERNP